MSVELLDCPGTLNSTNRSHQAALAIQGNGEVQPRGSQSLLCNSLVAKVCIPSYGFLSKCV